MKVLWLFVFIFFVFFSLLSEAADISLEKDLQNALEQSRSIIKNAKEKLNTSESITEDITQLKTLTEDIRSTYTLLQERFALREETTASINTKALERHQAMSEGYRKSLEEYLSLIDSLPSESSQYPVSSSQEINVAAGFSLRSNQESVIEQLQTLLDSILYKKKKPIIGSLPYKNLNYPAQEPNTSTSIKPAYKGGNKTVSTDDTKDTEEAPISNEIATLAQSLNWNPVSIYEYVKNNIETEWYWGCMKGAEETYHQKSGNDCDQATLLTALLRASGFPTRYIRGTMEYFKTKGEPIEKAKNLLGIEDPWKIAEYLQKAGIPYKTIISAGKVSNFQLEHIWVETQIPYGNYRGAIIDQSDKHWLGLDTSIKQKGYTYNTPTDIFQVSGVSSQLSAIRDQYLSTTRTQTPLEYTEEKLSALGYQLSDLKKTKTLKSEILKIVPASMQITQKNMTNEYTEIPDELMHKVRFTAIDTNNNELLNFELETFKLSNQKIAITYEAETVEDQEIIDSYGGLDNTPAYLVRLRPVLTVNGERMVVAQNGLPMGSDYNLTIELISPNRIESITNTHIVGNLAVIGIAAQKAVEITPSSSPLPQGGEEDKDAEQLLYEEAINYINRWNSAEEELASLFHLVISRPIPTVITIGGVLDVTYLLDTPHDVEWKGDYLDADIRAIEVTGTQSTDRTQTFMQLSALQGSVLEYRIFEDDWEVPSVSTANLIQYAQSTGVPIITIDKTNISSVLPTLPFDDNIIEDIQNSVNQNLTIKIPQSEITYKDWTGTGYIKENTETGEAGYMLSGMIASTGSLSGGSTRLSPEAWVNQDLAAILANPYSTTPNKDPNSAAKILKISATDGQEGTAGKSLLQPLMVFVVDKNNEPVQGAKVTFKVTAGGGNFGTDSTGKAIITYSTTTESTGIAKASLTLGKKTSDNPTEYWKTGYTYYQQVGLDIIDASLDSGISLSSPFNEYGFPDKPHHITKMYGDSKWGAILSFAGFVSILIEDENNNPIANKPITFEVQNITQNTEEPNCTNFYKDDRNALLTTTDDPCIKDSPTYYECTNAKTKLENVKTGTQGTASAQVILGGTPDAIYPIKATCTDTECTGNTFTTTFNLYSYYHNDCEEGHEPKTQLIVTYVYPMDTYGNSINAGKVGTTIPVQARLYYLKEGEGEATEQPCGSGGITCTKIIGSKQYTTGTTFKEATVTFEGQQGTPRNPEKNDGIYTSNYTLSTTAGINGINIEGTATIEARRSENTCSGGCIINNSKPITLNTATTTMQVYAVDIKIDQPPVILVDGNGYSKDYYDITYTITPSDYKPSTAYLFLYKENDPDPWWFMAETKSTGKATIEKGFQFDINSKYEAEIVLNNGTGVEMRSERMPIEIANLYIEKQDPEFPDLKLRWDDYYPALGDKTIVIKGTKSGGVPINNETIKGEVVSPTDGSASVTTETTFTEGKAEFKLSAQKIDASIASAIDLKFTYKTAELTATYNVKNNSNTTLSKVLSGEAVFLYDESTEENHMGKTDSTVTTDDDRKLDYVQEMLNQVVPRKRSVTSYTLMEEDGIYDSYVYNRLIDFKYNFNLNINDTVGSYTGGSDGKGTYGSTDNTTDTFRKLMKDYGKRREGSSWLIDGASNDSWLYKVIDKETLVGNTQRIPASTESLSSDNSDSLINKTSNSTRDDTGLYELYKNVVERFVNEMIKQAEYYSGDRGTAGIDAPTDNWRSRNNYGSAGCANTNPACTGEHGNGMSYCYGCKDDINGFNTTVANCQAESTTAIRNRETDSTNGNEYRGNIGTNCAVGSGSLDWAGITRDEYNLGLTPFSASYWAGIDCSGYVQRTVDSAGNVVYSLINLTIPAPPDWIGSQEFFTDNSRVLSLTNPQNRGQRVTLQKKLKKGDLVRYDGHISMIYSQKPSCDNTSCTYEIIHASGSERICYGLPGESEECTGFNRKVTTNEINRRIKGSLGNPTGFGRIKLWN